MNRVEEGIANFRSFQIQALDFFSRQDERAKNDEKQRNRRDQEIKDHLEAANSKVNIRLAIAALIVGVLTLLVGWLTYRDAKRTADIPASTTFIHADVPHLP
jgi:hypothetical protein